MLYTYIFELEHNFEMNEWMKTTICRMLNQNFNRLFLEKHN